MSFLPLLVVAAAHLPLLAVYFQQLWDRPHYQFFPLVLGASAYFMLQRWPLRSAPSRTAVAFSSGLMVMSGLVLAYSFVRLSPMFAYVSLTLVVATVLLRLGVPALGPWLLLLLAVRIPYGQDVALIQWMQRLTTSLSSTALDTIGIEHISDGNVLLFPTTSLFVEEACSGVVSLLAIVACGGILAVWWRRSIVHSLCLLAAGIFLAGAMNVVRVVTIAIALQSFDINLTEGWRHEALGLVVFAVSLLALLSLDRLLSFFLGPIDVNPLADYRDDAEGNILVQLWNAYCGLEEPDADFAPAVDESTPAGAAFRPPVAVRVWDWGLASLFLLLGAGQVLAGIGPFSVAPAISARALELEESSIPGQLNGWERIGFEVLERDGASAFGEHSRIWAFQKGLQTVRVSLDFVFPEWHALTACYQGVGWSLQESATQRPANDREFVEASFTKPNGDWALLMFDLFDDEGRPYEAPAGSFVHPKLRRIFSGESDRWSLPNYYQVQALSIAEASALTAEEREAVRELFVEFRQQMINRLRVGGAAAADESAVPPHSQPDTTSGMPHASPNSPSPLAEETASPRGRPPGATD